MQNKFTLSSHLLDFMINNVNFNFPYRNVTKKIIWNGIPSQFFADLDLFVFPKAKTSAVTNLQQVSLTKITLKFSSVHPTRHVWTICGTDQSMTQRFFFFLILLAWPKRQPSYSRPKSENCAIGEATLFASNSKDQHFLKYFWNRELPVVKKKFQKCRF